ncbi:NAD(P)H-binding protein [Comamonas sp.]|uniref:NmrA family NAD(P)-binding protein n=1 Tax=Comamonas sp. TaxID=34028 RepID=UPI0028988A1F|nr:NAD(P)H-binding protein [Comamonas sp.]
MYVVMGATGQVGGHVTRCLLEGGHRVRAVVRHAEGAERWRSQGVDVAVADAQDAEALRLAFQGAEGVFVMNPPAYGSEDMMGLARRVCASIRDAAMAAQVGRVVALSSVGAHRTAGTGNIGSNHLLEQALAGLPCAVGLLRPAWFIENAAGQLPFARDEGVAPSFLMPLDRAIPQVATADIGRVAAELLVGVWAGRRIVELGGPSDYAPADMAAAMGEIVGRAVHAVPFPREQWPGLFEQWGMSASAMQCWAEMIDGFNSGWISFEGGHERQHGKVGLVEALRACA